MKDMKLDIGHKPELDEVRIFAKSLVDAGDKKLLADMEEYLAKKGTEEEKACMVAIGMSFTMKKLGEMMVKFIDEGKLENPLDAKDIIADVLQHAYDGKEKDLDEKIKEMFDEDMDANKDGFKTEEEDMDKADIEDAFDMIDTVYKKTAIQLAKKYGPNNAMKFLATYCETFLKMLEDNARKEEEDEDLSPVDGAEEVNAKEALKDMRENGLDDVADALEKIIDKNGNTEIKVFRMKGKKNN